MKRTIAWIVIVVLIIAGFMIFHYNRVRSKYKGFASGNGRLEATEICIAAKLPARIVEMRVDEGDLVKEKEIVVVMETDDIKARMEQAIAQKKQAEALAVSAKAQIGVRESEIEAAKAVVIQKQSLEFGAKKTYERTLELSKKNVASAQQLDDDETSFLAAKAELATANALVAQAEAALGSAKADYEEAIANIAAAEAQIKSIQVELDDSILYAPRPGRIQYRIAELGEVMGAGGRVLNLADLTDVYMTFFLPERVAGTIAIGAEVRILLDALPEYPIPAKISYVASNAQFTPKTVETEIERQKMMFRIKARIDPKLLEEVIDMVKTGLPGVAWVKVDPDAQWPKELELNPMTDERVSKLGIDSSAPASAPAPENTDK